MTKQERTALMDFFQSTLKFNKTMIDFRRGASPKSPQDRALFEAEGEMVRICQQALVAFGGKQ